MRSIIKAGTILIKRKGSIDPVGYLSKGGIRDGTKDVSKGFNSGTIG